MLDAKRMYQIYDQLDYLDRQYEIMDLCGKGEQVIAEIKKLREELSEISSKATEEELENFYNVQR